jgi:hypothetical protein
MSLLLTMHFHFASIEPEKVTELAELLMGSVPDPIVVVDRESVTVYRNDKMEVYRLVETYQRVDPKTLNKEVGETK